MSELLASPWILEFRDRVEPNLTRLQRVALSYFWDWLDRYWQADGEYPKRHLHRLAEDLKPLIQRVEETAGTEETDAAIEALVGHLQSIPSAETIDQDYEARFGHLADRPGPKRTRRTD